MRRFVFAVSVLVVGFNVAACCFGNATGGLTLSGPPVAIAPGFAPDPMMLSGSAGGTVSANTQDASCRGNVAMLPNHTLQLSAPMSLRLLAHSDTDTTMVVRLADGTYLCNDDSDGFDPIVEHAFPAGDHNVWIGTFATGATASYTLGITVNPAIQPSTMGSGVVPPIGGPTLGGGRTPGTVLVTGVATVALVTGNVPGVTAGSTCTYTQSVSENPAPLDCRWRVECSGVVVYGDGDGGYAPCSDPSWPPGTLVADIQTTSGDRDASLIINPGGMSARDDATGPRGEYSVTCTMMPIMPPG